MVLVTMETPREVSDRFVLDCCYGTTCNMSQEHCWREVMNGHGSPRSPGEEEEGVQ